MGVPIILPHPYPPHAHMLSSGSSCPPARSRARHPSAPSSPPPSVEPDSVASPARDVAAAAAAPPPLAALGRRRRNDMRVHVENPSLAPRLSVRYESLAGQRVAVYRREKRDYEAGVLVPVWGWDPVDAFTTVSMSARRAASVIDSYAMVNASGRPGNRPTQPRAIIMRYDSGEEAALVLSREVWRLLHPTTGVVILQHVPAGAVELDEDDHLNDDEEFEEDESI